MAFIQGWYVLYTRPMLDNKVAYQLSSKNISFFYPKTKVIKQWKDKRSGAFSPLFPKYIYILLNSIKDYYDSLACEGVISYICFEKKLARVNDNIIKDLRVHLEYPEEIFISGDKFFPGIHFYTKRFSSKVFS